MEMMDEEGPQSPDAGGEGELMMELRCFLETGLNEGGRRRAYRSSASYLLENLPSSRGAVLEYYAGLLLNQHEDDPSPIKDVLLSFMAKDPISRAPLLAQWSLTLLGQFSSKFRPPIQKQGDMDEVMRFMMDFESVRMLMDLVSLCFSKISSSDSDDFSPASALLSTSGRHSPYFDWVVAYLGASFPETVISKVLAAGLENFYNRMCSSDASSSLQGPSESEDSVVGILDHLIGMQGENVVRGALKNILEKSLENVKLNKGNSVEISTFPFVLQLASISPSISKALTSLSTQLLHTPDIIDKIVKLVPKWNKTYFHSSGSLLDLVVHLIVGSRENGAEIFRLILETVELVSATNGCKILCETLLSEFLTLVHSQQQSSSGGYKNRSSRRDEDLDEVDKEIPCLASVSEKLHLFLCKDAFLSENNFVQEFTSTLLQLTSLIYPSGRGVAVEVIKYGLSNASNNFEIGYVLKFIQDIEVWHKDIALLAVKQALRNSKRNSSSSTLLSNLLIILDYEKQDEKDIPILSKFAPILRTYLGDLIDKLEQTHLIPQVIKIIRLTSFSPACIKLVDEISVSLLHRSIQKLVQALFTLLSQEPRPIKLILNIEEVLSCLSSNYPLSLPMILRFLMEGALCSKFASLFGGKFQQEELECKMRKEKFVGKSLLMDNMKFGSTPGVGATTLYHAGVIGTGNKSRLLNRENENASDNIMLFVNILFKICQFESRDKAKEANKQLALLCVDLISPDVMYNGLPWPDEEFTKVTVERDLEIKRTFDRHPILWPILFGIAEARPALCYCSVLIRALMSVALTHWQSASSTVKKASDHSLKVTETKNIIELMAVGQFLPHPLRSVGDIMDILSPFHVHCILIDIWMFMRENVPSPTAFTTTPSGGLYREFGVYKNFKSHSERLRLIMLKYLPQIAPEFIKFFIEPE
uniref:Oocyte maintenance defects [Nasonia vitripennis] n=1 Tax=Lepeophtheirus salmonis TaxID=72036 RepID=A0A0K2TWU2_LEPSM